MFNNIGKKIKKIATVFCYLGIIVSWLGGVVALLRIAIISGDAEGAAVGLLCGAVIIGLGSLSAWLGSIGIYGFGELIDKTVATADNTEKILVSINKNRTQTSLSQQDEYKLLRLKQMHESGEITNDEYMNAKADVLIGKADK